jgi:hypothetical protein
VAAILNFYIWGLGYLYIGKRRGFGILLLLGFAFPVLDLLYPPESLPPLTGIRLVSIAGYLILSLAFAYDAYRLAAEGSL